MDRGLRRRLVIFPIFYFYSDYFWLQTTPTQDGRYHRSRQIIIIAKYKTWKPQKQAKIFGEEYSISH